MEVRYFQLLGFDIHDDVKSRYLRQVIEREQEEQANFELEEKVGFIKNNITITGAISSSTVPNSDVLLTIDLALLPGGILYREKAPR